MNVSRIVCALDFSELSPKVEAYATALAQRYEAGLTLLHVDPPIPLMAPYGELPMDIGLFDDQRQRALADLAAAQHRGRAAGVPVDTALRGGQPSREILALAQDQSADLIVMGTHGHGGFEHLLLGSVAEKVLRKAPCAVMVVPPGDTAAAHGTFSHILCPIDGSASSADAVAFAVGLARESDGSLTLLRVVEPIPQGGEFATFDAGQYRALAEAEAAKALREAVPAGLRDWCHVHEQVAHGKASTGILATAGDMHADVIVMGVRGRSAIDLLAFGSTANEVVRRATCPVVAVHPKATVDGQAAPAPAAVLT